jgi:hypothetical protein
MKRSVVACVLFTLVTNACATVGRYERILDSWTGAEVSRLIENWGPPAGTYMMPDGRLLYTWFFDGGAVAVPIGNMAYAVQRYCRTTFTVSPNGIVERWRYEGNACRA